MSTENKGNESGVEKRVVGGEEQYAIWVPLTGAEGDALAKKAKAENVNVRYLVANLLREWMGPKELSAADLDAVVGGVTVSQIQPLNLNFSAINTKSTIQPLNIGNVASTVMCAW